MENASKALIIAGAILLSILIISLGIMIFRQASGVISNNAMDEVAVETFNEQFTQYEGKKVKGANVNALLQKIESNNLANSEDTSKQIDLAFKGTTTSSEKAQTGKAYDVYTYADKSSGYIHWIIINDAGADEPQDPRDNK